VRVGGGARVEDCAHRPFFLSLSNPPPAGKTEQRFSKTVQAAAKDIEVTH
jgi:hypothetical protein